MGRNKINGFRASFIRNDLIKVRPVRNEIFFDRSATASAKENETTRFNTAIVPIPMTASQKPHVESDAKPSAITPATKLPVESVTCRTSNGTPRNSKIAGDSPRRNPRDMLAARPAEFLRNQNEVFRALSEPSIEQIRGLLANACGRRRNITQ